MIQFREFVSIAEPAFQWFRFLDPIHDRLMDVAEGRLRGLIVRIPPRHGKTSLSRLFVRYMQHRKLSSSAVIVHAGHSWLARLKYRDLPAMDVGDDLHIYSEDRPSFDLIVVDDPARVPRAVRQLKKGWMPVMLSTLTDNGRHVVFLSSSAEALALGVGLTSDAIRYHTCAFDAIRDSSEPYPSVLAGDEDLASTPRFRSGIVATQWLGADVSEPDWRADGEVLCPELGNLDFYLSRKRAFGNALWNATYQQRPAVEDLSRESLPV
jgi:hypothetical protein